MRKLLLIGASLFLALSCQPKYSWENDLHGRLLRDFNKTREDVKTYIQKYIPQVTEDQIDQWTTSGELESMELDGKRLYFHNAGPNLFRINDECRQIKEEKDGTANPERKPMGKTDEAIAKNIPEVLSSEEVLTAPKRMRVKYTIRVHENVVPEGKTVRCWMPYPRTDIARQQDVKFLGASCKVDALNYFQTQSADSDLIQFADKDCPHSTLYMEAQAIKDFPIVFQEEFEYTSYAESHRNLEQRVRPYNKESELYRKYTQEREKHIRFTPRIKAIADSLTAGIKNPYLQAKALFTWVNDNFPWASAREYSTIENIPEYVLAGKHGDCGQVTLLFVTMCRYKGIPAHFQSGFMMHPRAWNLHDWGEIYFEGVGWVPVDQSFGIPTCLGLDTCTDEDYFFLGGIDSWRMVVNQDFGCPLSPTKKYPRSETVDFQRGEVEWEGGNLYFGCWDWDLEVTYL